MHTQLKARCHHDIGAFRTAAASHSLVAISYCDAASHCLCRPGNSGASTEGTAPTSTIPGARASTYTRPAATSSIGQGASATASGATGTALSFGVGIGSAGLGLYTGKLLLIMYLMHV